MAITERYGAIGIAPPPRERSIGELFGELANETSELVRQEVKLATTELTDKAKHAGKQVAVIAVGGLLGVIGVLVLSAALVLVLAYAMPLWVAALLVGAAFVGAAYAIVHKGIAALKTTKPLELTETFASLKEDKQWLTKQIH